MRRLHTASAGIIAVAVTRCSSGDLGGGAFELIRSGSSLGGRPACLMVCMCHADHCLWWPAVKAEMALCGCGRWMQQGLCRQGALEAAR